jgi:hypothetical protein
MIRGLSFITLLFLSSWVYSQSCTQRLNRAEDLFDAGKLLEVEREIARCLEEGGFSEAEEIRARKLLTKVAIFTDNEPRAEEELVNLLLLDPIHELQPEDPNELRVLMSKFRTEPIFRLELRVGGNLAITSVREGFSTVSGSGAEKDYGATLGLGFQGEIDITRHLFKGFEVGAGIQYRVTNYSVEALPNGGEVFQTNVTNSQSALRLPIFGRYNFNYFAASGPVPYVFAGASIDYYLTAKYSEASRSGGTAFTLSGSDADLTNFDQVNQLNYSVFLGGGFKFRWGRKGDFIFLEGRFDKSLRLYNVPEERYANDRLVSDLQYVEDDVFLDFVSINIGYVKSIFKPEKIR